MTTSIMLPANLPRGYGLQSLVDNMLVHLISSLKPVIVFFWILSAWDASSLGMGRYEWYTGTWKPCQSATCGGLGTTHQPVNCRDTHTNVSVSDTRCHSHSQPASQDAHCYRICDFHRYQYRWHASAWSPCQPIESQNAQNTRGGCQDGHYGLQTRNVSCVARCSGLAPSEEFCSAFERRPLSSRLCPLPCPKDCITGEYGSWSRCDSCFRRYKSRYKMVLRAPEAGGLECGKLADHEPCALEAECYDDRSSNFQYRLGEWSKCQVTEGRLRRRLRQFTGILGNQSRTVQCIDVYGNVARDERSCLFTGKRPLDQQLCVFPRDCLVSHWTNWSNWTSSGLPYPLGTSPRDSPHRTRGQVLTRNRNLIQVPHGEGGACPQLIDSKEEPEQVERAESCDRYLWLEGEWGECHPQLDTDHCGIGIQNRTVICVTVIDKVPVPDYQCATAAPVHTRLCERPCSSDCQVSGWGGWGPCLPDRCTDSGNRDRQQEGYRTRRRYVLSSASDSEDSYCPHLEESQPCAYPACYHWMEDTAAPPGQCELKYKDMSCGEGIVMVRRKCVDSRGKESPPSLCPPLLHTDTCHVPCGGDCVLSHWSDWSDCPEECDTAGEFHYRTRTRHVLAQPSKDGVQCLPEKQRQELDRCPLHSCVTYHWKATPWGPCTLRSHGNRRRGGGASGGHVTCGAGTREREVGCYRENGKNVGHKKCPEAQKPAESTTCQVACPRSCEVTKFSDWSDCSASCLSDEGRVASQSRRRFVLSRGHSLDCPPLEEERECKHLPTCERYSWQVGGWSHCFTLHKCGDGYRARDVLCVRERGRVPAEQLQEEMCISVLGSKPPSVESCEVGEGGDSCHQTCVLSSWTQWTDCSHRCNGRRKRWRSLEGDSHKVTSCHNSVKYPVQQEQHCNQCSQFTKMPIGRWSSCILNAPSPDPAKLVPLSTLRSNQHVCGIGNRYQALICNDGHGHNISAAACYSKEFSEFVEEVCFTPCSMDCVLSQWSEWGHCTTENRYPGPCTTKNRCGNGVRTRDRYVIEQALDQGRKCDFQGQEQYAHQPCHVPCEMYFWQTGEWSECSVQIRLEKSQRCGPGIRFRTVRCMRQAEVPSAEPVEVTASHCDLLSKPHTDSNCSVPCTGHCVTAQWSDWSTCSPTCEGRRHRTRSIARYPSPGIADSCGSLREEQLCFLGTNCFQYSLAWSVWTECVLPVGRDCGTGYRVSYSECVRSDGSPVHRKWCMQPGEEQSGVSRLMKEVCSVPCPVDCVVSQWTHWSHCSLTCGLGYRERFRHVVIPAAHGGRECPRELSQERPCPYSECFHWRVSDWTECEIPESSCGLGSQTRSLDCHRQDGLKVDRSLCQDGETTQFQLTRICHVSCPGDCWVSHWSEWGSCDRPCVQGITEGVQTRSRAIVSLPASPSRPCPFHLVETRGCEGGVCHTYHWRTSFWYGDHRSVWCERSDQLTVLGGCDPSTRPASLRRCSPPCSVPFSVCVDVDRCACVAGRVPVYHAETGGLVRCRLQQNNPSGSGNMQAGNNSNTSERVEGRHFLPENSSTNFWMYAVIAAGSAFIIFVVIAIYFILKHSRRDHLTEMSLRSRGSTINRKQHTVKSSSEVVVSDKSPSPSKLKVFIARTENEYT